MENSNDFFKSANEINYRILEMLKIAKKELDLIFNTHQRKSDIEKGLIYKNGIYLPYKSHRIFFDGYEVQFLYIFNGFFSRMLNEDKSLFKEFAIRTIAEMGLKESQILYSPDLSEEEKNKFKTITVLADYASLGFNHPSRIIEYRSLFREQKNLLSEKQVSIFESMDKNLDSKNYEEHKKLIKKIRYLIETTKDELYKKTVTPSLFRTENIETFFSGFSHILHGNIILLSDIISDKRPKNRNELRITWTLLLTGMNTLIHIKGFLERKKVIFDIGNLTEEFISCSKEISNYWEKIEN